jgi:hypothetical protein
MRKNIGRVFTAILLGALTSCLTPVFAAGADPVSGADHLAGAR